MANPLRPVIAIVLIAALAACGPSSPTRSPRVSAAPSETDGLPAGQAVRIDLGVEMSPDNLVVTLRFIGGPMLPTLDPCRTDYAGWARPRGDVLEVAVILLERSAPDRSTPFACSAIGADRAVQVTLEQPFLGASALDLPFGTTIPIARPEQYGLQRRGSTSDSPPS